MTEALDKAFDWILFSAILVCFGVAIFFIIHAPFSHLSSYQVRGDLWNAGILIGLGIIASWFFFYIKSWSNG